jgi:hypothetical protein
MNKLMKVTLAIVASISFMEVERARAVPLTDGADTVENSLEKVVVHTGSRGMGLPASANAAAVSSRAPSRRRLSKRKRKQGESLSQFDPRAEYIDPICPHGHMNTFCDRLGSPGSAHRRRRYRRRLHLRAKTTCRNDNSAHRRRRFRRRLPQKGGNPPGLEGRGPIRVDKRRGRLPAHHNYPT